MTRLSKAIKLIVIALALTCSSEAFSSIPGITGTTFDLTVKADYVDVADGDTVYVWGYADANNGSVMQYPGPTLIVNQGETITVNLINELPIVNDRLGNPVPPPNTSIVFPGQLGVDAAGGLQGLYTREAPPDGNTVVSYTFDATNAGTYIYQSGTRPELQIEMGLVGAIIVRPTDFDPNNMTAYDEPGTAYDTEFMFFFTEMDPDIHEAMEFGMVDDINNTDFYPAYWFLNGRTFPDTLVPAGVPWLPHQPYNCLPIMHPGQTLLTRFVGGGRDEHPFHTHGNNTLRIARDGRLLQTVQGEDVGPDLAISEYTQTIWPGSTVDELFEWTGKRLGFDVYGHDVNDPMEPNEYEPDHGKPFPTILPQQKDTTFGQFYSGSPFLGSMGSLSPGQGQNSVANGYFYMWHSHHEKEIVNNDIFPGGIMTALVIIQHPEVPDP